MLPQQHQISFFLSPHLLSLVLARSPHLTLHSLPFFGRYSLISLPARLIAFPCICVDGLQSVCLLQLFLNNYLTYEFSQGLQSRPSHISAEFRTSRRPQQVRRISLDHVYPKHTEPRPIRTDLLQPKITMVCTLRVNVCCPTHNSHTR